MNIPELIRHLSAPPCEKCGRRAASSGRFRADGGVVYDVLCTGCKFSITFTPERKRRLQAEMTLAFGPMSKAPGES